jgi:hypothetical protein
MRAPEPSWSRRYPATVPSAERCGAPPDLLAAADGVMLSVRSLLTASFRRSGN